MERKDAEPGAPVLRGDGARKKRQLVEDHRIDVVVLESTLRPKRRGSEFDALYLRRAYAADPSGELPGGKLSGADRGDVPGAPDSIDNRLNAGKCRFSMIPSDLVYVIELARFIRAV
jgi:hypothetical protein